MAIDPRVDIGHVHLKVADVERSLAFYVGVLGFELQHRFGDQAAFISAGGYHHHIGLNTWESAGRLTASGWHDRALSRGDPLSRPRHPGRRAAPAVGPPATGSTARPTTGSARRSTCATPTTTASSSTATGPKPNGRARRRASSRCSTRRSTSTRCSPKPARGRPAGEPGGSPARLPTVPRGGVRAPRASTRSGRECGPRDAEWWWSRPTEAARTAPRPATSSLRNPDAQHSPPHQVSRRSLT